MKKHDEAHFLRFGLIAVFLIATLTILGMVVLVANGTPRYVVLGSQFAAAEEESPSGVHGYLGFDVERDVVLLGHASGPREIPVDLWGFGFIPFGDEHEIRVLQTNSADSPLRVDADADGSFETTVLPGEAFELDAEQNLVGAAFTRSPTPTTSTSGGGSTCTCAGGCRCVNPGDPTRKACLDYCAKRIP